MNIKKRVVPILEKELGEVTFGMYLRSARAAMDISQTDLAHRLRISRGTLCDIEKGRQLVSPRLALKIARISGFSEKLALETCIQDQLRKAKIKMKVSLVA